MKNLCALLHRGNRYISFVGVSDLKSEFRDTIEVVAMGVQKLCEEDGEAVEQWECEEEGEEARGRGACKHCNCEEFMPGRYNSCINEVTEYEIENKRIELLTIERTHFIVFALFSGEKYIESPDDGERYFLGVLARSQIKVELVQEVISERTFICSHSAEAHERKKGSSNMGQLQKAFKYYNRGAVVANLFGVPAPLFPGSEVLEILGLF